MPRNLLSIDLRGGERDQVVTAQSDERVNVWKRGGVKGQGPVSDVDFNLHESKIHNSEQVTV